MFENKGMIIIFGNKKDKVIGGCRKIHNNDIYEIPSLNTTREIKSKRMRIRDAIGM